MKALLEVHHTSTYTPCYDVRVRYQGIRKRARKVEGHSITLLNNVATESILDADGTLNIEARDTLTLMARKALDEHAREVTGKASIQISYVKRAHEDGFVSTQYEPFGTGHFRIELDGDNV